MSTLQKKIDFALVLRVRNANPNGDPLNGNRPRTDYGGFGEITDVCIKRKLRDRLQEAGQSIFVQSDDRKIDGETSLKNRSESEANGLGKAVWKEKGKREEAGRKACAKWFDVRAFGQVFAYAKGAEAEGVSVAIRGPVTVQSAFSKEPVSVTHTKITKSVNNEGDGGKRGPDTMGDKYRIEGESIYECYGSINPQLAVKTGFNDADADVIKAILPKLFENDASSARPDGSMAILKVIWWKHSSKAGQYSAARVHDSLRTLLNDDGTFDEAALRAKFADLEPEIIDGF